MTLTLGITLTLNLIAKVCSLPCGHRFRHHELKLWLTDKRTCPLCNDEITIRRLKGLPEESNECEPPGLASEDETNIHVNVFHNLASRDVYSDEASESEHSHPAQGVISGLEVPEVERIPSPSASPRAVGATAS